PMGSFPLTVPLICLLALLLHLILDVLPFVERAQACALDCGDVHEHDLAARLRLNESIALIRIEPLHRAARHCRSPVDDAQILFWICSLAAKTAVELCTSRFGARSPWSRRRRKGRIEWPGYRRGKSDAPACSRLHAVACTLRGRIGADGDARYGERLLQLLSCGRRRAAARHPHRSDLAVQPERCRLGVQSGTRRTLGSRDRDCPPAGRECDLKETAFGPWTTRTRCAGSIHRTARRSGAQAAQRCGRRQGDFLS